MDESGPMMEKSIKPYPPKYFEELTEKEQINRLREVIMLLVKNQTKLEEIVWLLKQHRHDNTHGDVQVNIAYADKDAVFPRTIMTPTGWLEERK